MKEGDDDVGGLVPLNKRKHSGKGPNTQERNSQGKDPRTLKENIQGGSVGTPLKNSQGEDPRTCEAPVQRWESSEKVERKEVKMEKEEKEENSEVQKKQLVDNAQRTNLEPFFVSERQEEDVEEKGRKRNKSPRAKQVLGKSEDGCFFS